MRKDDAARAALLELLSALDAAAYDFTTITPASHGLVVARGEKMVARDLRDIFGWSRPFAADLIAPRLIELLERAGLLARRADLLASDVRVSRVGGRLFLHSAYPTEDADAVFLGPDTYRFARFIRAELERAPRVGRIADIGAGAGVGGILAATWSGAPATLADVNADALWLASVNAAHAGCAARTVEADGLPDDGMVYDLIIANPPFIMDPKARKYRDGGDLHGGGLSRDWALAAADRLPAGGRLLLYTGSAIVDGRDALRAVLDAELPKRGCTLRYEEIDPDIFGEELAGTAYADVERIAAVGAVATKE